MQPKNELICWNKMSPALGHMKVILIHICSTFTHIIFHLPSFGEKITSPKLVKVNFPKAGYIGVDEKITDYVDMGRGLL